MRLFSFLLFTISFISMHAQPSIPKEKADSLWSIWSNESASDSLRLRAIHTYIWNGYLFSKPDSACYFSQLEYDFANRKGLVKGKSVAMLKMGISYSVRGEYDKAINHYQEGLRFAKAIDDIKMQSSHLTNIGISYEEQGRFDKAITFYLKGLKIDEEHDDSLGMGITLNNIGVVYMEQEAYPKAIKYFNKSKTICEKIGDSIGIASALNIMGIIYKEQESYGEALKCQERALKIQKKLNDEKGMTSSLNNLGVIHQMLGNFNKATEVHNQSLEITTNINDKRGQVISLNNLGEALKEKGNIQQAIKYSKRALTIAQEIGVMVEVRSASKTLFECYKKLNRFAQALKMHELFVRTQDSIHNEEKQRAVLQQEYKFKYEKKAALDSMEYAKEQKIIQAEADKKDAEIKTRKNQQYALFSGLGLVVMFSAVLFNRFQTTQRQKGIIEVQKNEVEKQRDLAQKEHKEASLQRDIVEQKNTEIMDSIQYAKRLQDAILPPVKLVKQYFEESFILYRPKDIVSGDFYWMESKDNLIMFAAADCTGHGVPGALVSVVCANALYKSVNELGKTDPADILNTTRELVIETFSKSEDEVNDGMDISLCVLNEGTKTLHWAGANNPLWIVRRDQNDIQVIKADKTPIGLYGDNKPFTSHSIKINEGDSIYLFSDGYADQFGGEKGKKLKSSKFKELLLELRYNNMSQQKQLLEKAFDDWKGKLEQVDDVCIIGVKLTEKEVNPFTRREMEVLQLLDQGLSSKLIAEEFSISKSTVDTHRKKMLRKVEVNSVTELLSVARTNKWLT